MAVIIEVTIIFIETERKGKNISDKDHEIKKKKS